MFGRRTVVVVFSISKVSVTWVVCPLIFVPYPADYCDVEENLDLSSFVMRLQCQESARSVPPLSPLPGTCHHYRELYVEEIGAPVVGRSPGKRCSLFVLVVLFTANSGHVRSQNLPIFPNMTKSRVRNTFIMYVITNSLKRFRYKMIRSKK